MKLKRILCTLLAALMLLPATACANSDGDDPAATTAPEGQTLEEKETGDPNYTCDLPDDLDFEGAEVNILYVDVESRGDELHSEKLGYGTVSDAVYERNVTVENQLGVKLGFLDVNGDGTASGKVRSLVGAGDRSVDIFTLASYIAMADAITGVYLDLNQLEYVDTSKHYWSQDYNTVATFTSANKQFLATSPAALSVFRFAFLTIFNADLMKERSLPNLYDKVDNGEWTLDLQYSLIHDVYVDNDGDGRRSEGDFYGHLGGDTISIDPYSIACGINFVIRDESGDWVFNGDALDKGVSMGEKVGKLLNAPGTYKYTTAGHDFVGDNSLIKKFSEEGSLMATVNFLALEKRIGALAELSYGIVPMPKLNETQPQYRTYVQDSVTGFGVSAAIGNEEDQNRVGAVMEAIAYYSNEIVRPAYYDSSLSLRFMQDPRSREMLDIMFETIAYEYSFLRPNGMGNILADLRRELPKSNPALASYFKRWNKAVKNALEKEQKSLDKLA